MPISAMHLIENQSSTIKHIDNKKWLTTSETIDYIKKNCPLFWKEEFRYLGGDSQRNKLYKFAYEAKYGIESDSFYDNGGRLSRFYSKRSLDRANEVIQYRKNSLDFWSANSVLKNKNKELEEAKNKIKYYSNLVNKLEKELKTGTLQEKVENERIKSIKKDKETLTFDVDELHKLSSSL